MGSFDDNAGLVFLFFYAIVCRISQVDEIVNLSCPLKGRYQSAPAGLKRCLKLSMTDGVQRVFGMEYRPIKDLEVLAPAGMKVIETCVCVCGVWTNAKSLPVDFQGLEKLWLHVAMIASHLDLFNLVK